MSIGFEEVPGNLRVPFLYAEFSNAGAVQGPTNQPYRALMIGPKLAGGTAVADQLVLVSSFAEAKTLFGAGSLLANMVEGFKDNNKFQELWCLPVLDNGAGVPAAGSIEATGGPTAAGTLNVYIAGKRVQIPVASGQSLASIISDLKDAMDLDPDLLVSAVINATPEILDLTAKNDGIPGNDIDIRFNYNPEDELPAGLGTTIVAMTAGATNPDLTTALANIDDKQYILGISAFLDSANRLLIEAEMKDRFGPLLQTDGYFHYFSRGTLGEQVTVGSDLNSQFTSVIDVLGPLHGAVQISRIIGEVVAAAEIDPARPFQNIEVTGLLAPEESERRKLVDRNTLLFNGIATYKVQGDTVIIERMITTYQTNVAGADDVSYLNLNTLLILSFIRFDWRNFMLGKYPRHKLANDGTRFAEGQPIMTPGLGKAEAIFKFGQWEFDGLVEGLEQFKEALIVERNTGDVDRLDFLLQPDLINQLRIMGTQIKFLL